MTTTTKPNQPAAHAPERFQFRIRDLLLVTMLVALAAAAGVQQGIWLWPIFMVAAIGCLAIWGQWTLANVITSFLIMATLFLLFAPAIDPGKGPNHRGRCSNNLKQIVLALENYHDTYGSFPPAYIADKSGRPMHSWRVLILPFMEHERLYSLYRLDEPWDGPNNRKLADRQMFPRVYACSAEDQAKNVETSYVAIVGPHTAWPGEKATSLADFKDGAENVLLVVEVHHSGIHWMEPRDLHVSQMAPTINAEHGQGISSQHSRCANAAFANGMTERLPDELPARVLRSWITIDDGTQTWPPLP